MTDLTYPRDTDDAPELSFQPDVFSEQGHLLGCG